MKEKNSKIVKLMRTIPFSQAANMDITEFFGGAVRGVGSYFKGKKPGSGLTFKEEELLMPSVINLPPNDRDFRKQVELYFTDITTKVPEKGLPLEIGLKESNDMPLSDTNLPINIEEYIMYKHAIAHPHTAMTEDEAKGNQLKMFYILDSQKTADALKIENDLRDEAMTKYLTIKENRETVDMVLTNLGIDTREMDNDSMVRKLKEYINAEDIAQAKYFLLISGDNKLNIKYRLNCLVQANILKKVGTRFVITESGDIIGKDLSEAVIWWEDKSNSDIVGTLRARYQEFSKKNNKIEIE